MARKVINTTHAANRYDILSQTPKNYNQDNWYLKELQDKIDMDWPYRPNRVDIEYEDAWGRQTYKPIEVVIQSVRSEKGTQISDDCKNIVFRNIFEKRFRVGSRFRFGDFIGQASIDEVPLDERNIWLGINFNSTNMTQALVVQRCNGMLGSRFTDPVTGLATVHYEPVVLPQTLSATSFHYDNTVVQDDADLLAIVQTNEFTRQYFVNQRFILGYGAERKQVYRIKSIHDFYANTTEITDATIPKSQGLTRLYLEITETSPDDDFVARIAAQSVGSPVLVQENRTSDYAIQFTTPVPVPVALGNTAVVFTPKLVDASGTAITVPFTLKHELLNLPTGVSADQYLTVSQEGGAFTLTRKRVYLGGDLVLTWSVAAASSPTGKALEYTMQLGMGTYA